MKHLLAVIIGLVLLAGAAPAQQMPDAFVNRVFAKYAQRDHWPPRYKPCYEFCDASFASLIDEAHLRYDPICQCRSGGDRLVVLAGKLLGNDGYQITVRDLSNTDRYRQWVLVLRLVLGNWTIDDVIEMHNGNFESLRQRLLGANQEHTP